MPGSRPQKRQRKRRPAVTDDARPVPPPPAPESLIQLLKKDKQVLDYFRALQANLHYDVEKWKKRTLAYQKIVEDLKLEEKQNEQRWRKLNREIQTQKQRERNRGKLRRERHDDTGRDAVPSIPAAAKEDPPGDAAPVAAAGVQIAVKEGAAAAKTTTAEETKHDDQAFDFEESYDFELSSCSSSEEENMNDGEKGDILSTEQTVRATNSYKFNVDDDDDDDDDDGDGDNDDDGNGDYDDGSDNGSSVVCFNDESNKNTVDDNSSEDVVNRKIGEITAERLTASEDASVETTSKADMVPERIRMGWKFLRKADNYLKEIGIVLASAIEVVENDVKSDIDSDLSDFIEDNKLDSQNRNGCKHVSSGKAGIENNAKSSKTSKYTSYIRKSDNAVLGDIVQTIKEWTKLKVTANLVLESPETLAGRTEHKQHDNDGARTKTKKIKYQYAAFMTNETIPCFVPIPDRLLYYGEFPEVRDETKFEPPTAPQHPAVSGVELLLKALSWIDAFGPLLDELQVDGELDDGGNNNSKEHTLSYYAQLVRSEDDTAHIEGDSSENSWSSAKLFITGMKERYVMVQNFVTSLEGEICDLWPVQDRFNRIGNLALHCDNYGSSRDRAGSPEDFINIRSKAGRMLVFDSKNSLRLVTMAERCILARIIVAIYLQRNDPLSAKKFLFRYILATAPSLEQEESPKYPPVLSLLMIETILNTPWTSQLTSRTFFDYLLDNLLMPDRSRDEKTKSVEEKENNHLSSGTNGSHPMNELFHLVLTFPAAIWRLRLAHEDTRISEPGLVEEAAYMRMASRLKESGVESFIPLDSESSVYDPFLPYTKYSEKLIARFFKKLTTNEDDIRSRETIKRESTVLAWMLPFAMILQGSSDKLRSIFSARSNIFLTSQSTKDLLLLEACSKAMRQLEIRNINSYRAVISSPNSFSEVTSICQSAMTCFVDSIITGILEDNGRHGMLEPDNLSILLGICHELADGENALRLYQFWLHSTSNDQMHENILSQVKEISLIANHWLSLPMIRVINLERRKDRLASFLSQAMHAGLWAIRGVIPPKRWQALELQKQNADERSNREVSCDLTAYIGTHAFDGSQESPAQVERKLMEWLQLGEFTNLASSKRDLSQLVMPQWRPNDLRAFDVHASEDPNLLVPLSPSEKACALSHIATWKGIASLSTANQFTYAGLARGDPMHGPMDKIGKDRMPPCPVALVLEDDAVLVDRFKERLDQLLEELPRDFHYCALGYAKPKEAPLVDICGCEHIKLPTMTWYLTGYLLSQAGAQYLLDRLPVVGPIDAWMGRKMIFMSNWENEYGHRMGVGDAPQNGSDRERPAMSRKDIRTCVQFRAYCAGVPLCDQKVRTPSATGASTSHHRDKPAQNWRRRDSDIVYSGNVSGAQNVHRKRANRRKSF